jgi:phage anti-repressor protein
LDKINIKDKDFLNFVDNFYDIYVEKNNQDKFMINLDKLVLLLKCDKMHLKVTLLNSYKKDIDYTIKNQKSTGGRPSELIMLTPNCFKRLCMRSKTKKAEEIRTYFIELEKYLDEYKNCIIQSLNKKINCLKNNI